MAGLSPSGAYLPLADVLARAKAEGGSGDVLKIDLEWDLERSVATWDVTFSNGVEYEFDAATGALLGSKQKAAAKLATMLPIGLERGTGIKGFAEIMRGAEASAGRPVQEMELKRIKGQDRAIFEVVLVDGTTIFYDAATGAKADAV
jgi:uncharacterized membrane protein YkoI